MRRPITLDDFQELSSELAGTGVGVRALEGPGPHRLTIVLRPTWWIRLCWWIYGGNERAIVLDRVREPLRLVKPVNLALEVRFDDEVEA